MAMNEFLDVAAAFPTVAFSFLLMVVVVYWLLVIITGAVSDGPGAGAGARWSRFASAVGLGGVPANLVVSVMIVLAWLVCVTVTYLVDDAGDSSGAAGAFVVVGVPLVAVLVAWLGTALLVRSIGRAGPERPPVPTDLVGDLCIVRSADVGADFGVAELATGDGAPTLIEVRQAGADELSTGSTALIVEYEPGHDVFWVRAFEPDLGTQP